MGYLIILFGLMIVAVAAVMFVRPAIFVDRMRQLSGTASLQLVAVVVRLILGFALVTYAGQSRFPLALQIIGVISIAAAVIIAAIPRSRFERLITWVLVDSNTGPG